MQLKSVTAVSLLLLVACGALRILVVFPMASRSHSILGHGVVNRLLEAGHEVVHLTAIPREEPEKKLREIIVPNAIEKLRAADPENFYALTLKNMVGQPNYGDSIFNFAFDFHKLFLEDKTVVEFLGDPREKFDAVVVEWLFSDVVAGIAPLFECPLIWLGPTEAHWQVLKLVDTIPSPALNVDMFSTKKLPLNFWDRFAELCKMIKKVALTNIVSYRKEHELYNSYFPSIAAKRGVTMPPYETAVYSGSLLLLNSHPTIGTPYSLPQSAKYVGGYHIDFKAKPLPPDLQNLMDFARYGVIYFSMGSTLKSADMSEDMKRSLLDIFSIFKQRIIWKFEGRLDNIPPNVYLVKWAPQQSILAHSTLKMFITHGGQLSTTEAVHYGVPVIGIPVLGDQHMNMDAVVRKGFGIKVPLTDNLAFEVGQAMSRILVNPKFKERAQELSEAYHHRPVSPRKELVYWVEHVAKTRGALHLRSPALMLPWYQTYYLDLIALVFSLLMLIIEFVKKIILFIRVRQQIKNMRYAKSFLKENKETDQVDDEPRVRKVRSEAEMRLIRRLRRSLSR